MKKFFILFCFLILSLPSKSQVKDIKVFGVKRISPDMVKNVINLKEDEKITDKKLNDIVRKLYNTGYFSDVKLSEKNNILEITVAENPTVNAVSFEGYSDLKLDDIKKDVKTRPHSIYNPAQIKSDVETIKNLYKRLGNFKAVVDAKIIERDNNQYDVVFEITEGKKAYIKDITFNGNESFSPNELQEVILSKEYSWWKLLEMYDTYDEDRLLYDSELLKNFYNFFYKLIEK